MASIGTLEPTRDGGWTGPLFLLGQHVKVKLAPNDNQTNPKAPAFRILAGAAELGALWPHKTRDEKSQDYLSGEADFPGLPEPISLAVFFAEDGRSARAIWSRKDEKQSSD